MTQLPPCPKCQAEYTYEDRGNLICPSCGHEWLKDDIEGNTKNDDGNLDITDAVGNPLCDGDTVSVIKDLKIKGSSQVVKVGTKVKNIRLVEGDHDIDCKIKGIGPMKLKSIYVKKA